MSTTPQQQRKITIFSTVAIIIVVWLWYLLRILFNIDILKYLGRNKDSTLDPSILLYIVIATTVIAATWCALTLRKHKNLAARGIPITATVKSISLLGKIPGLPRTGNTPVTIVYTVDGKEYSSRQDLPSGDYKEGQTLQIIYDPKNPKDWKFA